MYRTECHSPVVCHTNKINKVISNACQSNQDLLEVEKGLFYFATQQFVPDVLDAAVSQCTKPPIVTMLNSARDTWEVKAYQPLVLSINNSEALYKFHSGNLIIMTIIDIGFIEEYIENNGLMVKLLNDNEYVMEVSRIKEDKNKCNTIQVSAHFFGRVSFEFISLTWFLDELIYRIEKIHEVADSSKKDILE